MPDDLQPIITGGSAKEITGKSGFGSVGVITGMVLFLGSFPLLMWNEGRAAANIKNTQEEGAPVLSVSAVNPDPANNGKLIHITGQASTHDVLSDEIFYVSVNTAKLRRSVEMYQWKEKEHSIAKIQPGLPTDIVKTYTYSRTWSEIPLSSEAFQQSMGHNNPVMPYRSSEYSASAVKVGDFLLTAPLIDKIKLFEDYPITPEIYAKINPKLTTFKRNGTDYYSGSNSASPAVGDVRVRFRIVPPDGIVSVIGKQNGDKIEPFDNNGTTIALVSSGEVDAEGMLQAGKSHRSFSTWGIRLGGWLGMLFGLALMVSVMKRKREAEQKIPGAVKYFKVPRQFIIPHQPSHS